MFSTPDPPKVEKPPKPPTLDEAAQLRIKNQTSQVGRGRASTILTSDTGLPDLGSTTRPVAGGY